MGLREQQAPIKEGYLEDPESAKVTLTARGSQAGEAVSCSVDLGRMVQEAQAHEGVGGPGTGACSGDLLLGALAACAQVTSQMVAANTGIDARIEVVAEGVVDLRGTLGVDREAPVGFESINLRFEIDAPDASAEELEALHAKSERYCTVLQTLLDAPKIESELVTDGGG
jgi:uncharacterized OsmC-like protein